MLLLGLPAAAVVDFPGPVKEARSPTSRARIFYRYHLGPDGGQAHPVFLDDGHRHVTQIATVTRNMLVTWSPNGRHVFLQDNWGSDIADCYVVTLGARVTGVSLLKRIRRTPGHPSGEERAYHSHYYVGCDHWRSSERLVGTVTGHTDSNPMHDFDHPFTYDARTRRLRWGR